MATKINITGTRLFFLVLFGVIGYFALQVLQSYIAVILISLITVLLFEPVYRFIRNMIVPYDSLSNTLTLVVIVLCVVVPSVILADIVYRQAMVFNDDIDDIVKTQEIDGYEDLLAEVNEVLIELPGEYQITEDEVIDAARDIAQPIGEYFTNNAVSLTSSALSLITNIIVYFTLVSFLLPLRKKMITFIKAMSPLPNELDDIYINRVSAMTVSMVKGTFVVALVQGMVAAVFFYILGIPYPAFWTLLVIFFSIIPIGSGIVMLPLALFLAITGDYVGAVILFLSNVVVITNIDNFLRPRLVSKHARLHPALTLLGVLGGIQAFGFLGIVYGPVIMIMLVTTIEIYQEHYRLETKA